MRTSERRVPKLDRRKLRKGRRPPIGPKRPPARLPLHRSAQAYVARPGSIAFRTYKLRRRKAADWRNRSAVDPVCPGLRGTSSQGSATTGPSPAGCISRSCAAGSASMAPCARETPLRSLSAASQGYSCPLLARKKRRQANYFAKSHPPFSEL